MKGKVLSINISKAKGTPKTSINPGKLIKDFGFEGDAHAGKWHRQVSLLSWQKIEAFRARGAKALLRQSLLRQLPPGGEARLP